VEIPVGPYLLECSDPGARMPTVRMEVQVQCAPYGVMQVDIRYHPLYLPILQASYTKE